MIKVRQVKRISQIQRVMFEILKRNIGKRAFTAFLEHVGGLLLVGLDVGDLKEVFISGFLDDRHLFSDGGDGTLDRSLDSDGHCIIVLRWVPGRGCKYPIWKAWA